MTIWKGPPAVQEQAKPKNIFKLSKPDLDLIKKYLLSNYSVSNIAKLMGVKDYIIYGLRKRGRPIKLERTPPFEIEDKKISKLIAYNFEWEYCKGIRREFTMSKNPNDLEEITITGIINDYKFKCTNKDHITITSQRCSDLNEYFFHDIKP